MLRRPLLSFLFAFGLGALLVAGLARLFFLRYESGDIYPPYSSLRADPLGTRAIADALDQLPGVEVQRNFKPLPKLRPKGPVTLVYAGVTPKAFWTAPELLAFNSLVAGGSRAVFTFFPVETPPSKRKEDSDEAGERKKKEEKTEDENVGEKKKGGGHGKKPADKKSADKKSDEKKTPASDKSKDEDEEEHLIRFDDVAKSWGFGFGYLPEEKGQAYHRHAALVEPGGHLESDISWHTALDFTNLKPQWKVLYMCGTMPVVIERRYGNGSIVLVADSFLLSNEAIRAERQSRLLSRLFSGPPTIVFDEEHNDVREHPGVASLVHKYRLHGVIAGLLLLALLFVWKNAVRFVPAYEMPAEERDVVAGKESGEGFINLLRRTVAPSAIFDTCMAEWRKAFAHNPRDLAKAAEALAHEQTRPAAYRNALTSYRAISQALARKK